MFAKNIQVYDHKNKCFQHFQINGGQIAHTGTAQHAEGPVIQPKFTNLDQGDRDAFHKLITDLINFEKTLLDAYYVSAG